MVISALNNFLLNNAMEKMQVLDGNAYDYLMDIPIERWSKHVFNLRVKSSYITNNMCESFNS